MDIVNPRRTFISNWESVCLLLLLLSNISQEKVEQNDAHNLSTIMCLRQEIEVSSELGEAPLPLLTLRTTRTPARTTSWPNPPCLRPARASSKVFFVPRTVSGEAFSSLLASADVVLHPFPFGGSKTSADALAVGVRPAVNFDMETV